MINLNSKLYVSDISEAEKNAPEYGDAQVLIAGETEKEEGYEKSGNQKKEYYQK